MTSDTRGSAAMLPTPDSSWWLLPEQVRDIAEVIGLQGAMRLVGALCPARTDDQAPRITGRVGMAYVPQQPTGTSFARLVGIIGHDHALSLIEVFGGSEIRVPACTAFTNRGRDASVRGYWRDSKLSAAWIGWLHYLTERQVRNICRGEPRLAVAANGGRAKGMEAPPPKQFQF